MEGYVLLMPFLDESSNFSNGFAMGQMWEKMSNNEIYKDHSIHRDNEQQVVLMCGHFGYIWSFAEYDEEWLIFNAQPIDISEIRN